MAKATWSQSASTAVLGAGDGADPSSIMSIGTSSPNDAQQADAASLPTPPQISVPVLVSILNRTPTVSSVEPMGDVMDGVPTTLTSVIVAPSKSPGVVKVLLPLSPSP